MKLVDLLNKMPNIQLVKVEVYVFGETSERNRDGAGLSCKWNQYTV